MRALDFYLTWFRLAFQGSLSFAGIPATAVIYGALTLLIGSVFSVSQAEHSVIQYLVDFAWKGGGIAFCIVFVISGLIAPLKIHLEDQKVISGLRTSIPQQLELTFNKSNSQHVFVLGDNRKLYRVGLLNHGPDIKGSSVKIKSLEAFGPNKNGNGRLLNHLWEAMLLAQHARGDSRGKPVDLRHLEERNFDLVEAMSPTDSRFNIRHAIVDNPPLEAIPRGCYRVRLVAHAENCVPVERDFWIGSNGRQELIVAPVKHSGS